MTQRSRAFFLERLAQRCNVSVLIIGGGINGAGLFRDLAMQQVDCLLIDKADFASGASSAPSRLIHGGLKYLETGEFRLVAESTLERNLLLKNAPHFVRPLETVLPIQSYFGGIVASALRFFGIKSKLADRGMIISKLGLTIYDFLGRHHRTMPRHHVAFKTRSLRNLPVLDPAIKATATYFDAQVTQAERLNYELVADGLAACEEAAAANYVTVDHVEDEKVWLRDLMSDRLFPVTPTIIINASGAWIDSVNHSLGIKRKYIGGTKGSHLIVDHPELYAQLCGRMVYFGSKDGRICLVYPFMDRLLVGSTDIRVDDPDEIRCEDSEVEYMFGALREIFPRLRVDASNISFRYSGVRPLPYSDAANPGEVSRDHVVHIDHLPDTRIPVLSLVGGKWTTFRGFAESVADDTLERLGRSRRVSTRDAAIGGGHDFPRTSGDRAAWINELATRCGVPVERAETLLSRYGTSASAIAAFCSPAHGGPPDTPLASEPSYTVREIQYICEHEAVTHLADLLLRRTTIALSGKLTHAVLAETATVAARALGWDSNRMRGEIDAARDIATQRHGVVLRETEGDDVRVSP
ncbi:glycerol-3-phosphate dehydrogenase/oxidase (plasmid) [Burkholderia humptydooensis]|uniref:Glycerol-3-phosphate dehydrogenase/oxidase n=2 Tax=Burkholderia humptydooensis TaxID=430531 RepID=A0A7U4STY7_9BURK|nr:MULTISPECIES: glycerol-3-phosphate dehydrogenase/oxidase [Burkholderia]AJY38081.1 FAD dependent oxidoreductase family protein [Burkholderia sp. 2002721687]ALX44590.1 glycerol-3-phosphate dehydrogenase [Burkholderia humptydooensis]EIP84990.1 putative glycerol-3-phosphate dehydrogenase [Burkholderia humptydooensis MSMB43]QPS42026.1 glycerol-3-phosphate dehydrogenase/oxidase [Burkholderia humptydooensis]